jgi:WD40 repeat protein
MATVFISHSSGDAQRATAIAEKLKERDFFSYFLDHDVERGIHAGRHWEKELYRRLLTCKAVVFVCTPESVSSKWCFAELTHARALGKPIVPVRTSDCALPEILRDVQAVDLHENAETAYARLWTALERIGVSEEDGAAWREDRPPYPGILPFDETDTAVFFGRRSEAGHLLELLERMRVAETRLAVIIGASGSGKSSLVRAGLVPRMRRARADWIPLDPVVAGSALLEDLAERLTVAFPDAGERPDFGAVHRVLADAASDVGQMEGGALSSLLRRLRIASGRKDAHVVWIVDQAERLLVRDRAAEAALRLIGNCASAPGLPLQLVLTLRSDHLDAFLASPAMDDVRFESVPLARLSMRRFGEVIEGPARLAGLELGPGLVAALVTDASRKDGLPLLAFVLRELWERYGEPQGLITLDDYHTGLGGLEGCIGKRAGKLIEEQPITDAERALLRSTMCRMARIGEGDSFVGQPIAWSSIPEPVRATIERLLDGRLLVSSTEHERQVEVAHDVLFNAWDELRGWLEDERQFLRWQRSLQLPLREWQQHGRDVEEVHLSGALLREASGWLASHGASMTEAERLLVTASLDRARAEEQRWQRSYQLSLAQQLSAQAQVILSTESAEHTERALLLATESMRRYIDLGIPSLEADQVLREVLSISAKRMLHTRSEQQVSASAVDVHPRAAVVAYGQNDGHVRLWNLSTNETNAGPRLTSAVERLSFSPDGRWLAIAGTSGECLLVDTAAGQIRSLDATSPETVHALAFSSDSSLVAVGFRRQALVWACDGGGEPTMVELPVGIGGPIVSLTFSGDGAVLVTLPLASAALCWNWRSQKIVGGLGERAGQVLHSPDGGFLAVAGWPGFQAILWDIYKRESRQIANNAARLAFSSNGQYVAIASPEHFARIWHLPDLTVAHTLRHSAEVWNVEFSPNGSMLATVGKNGVVHIWDVETGAELARMVHSGTVSSIRFLLDSRHLVTHSGDAVLTVWKIRDLREIAVFEHPVAVLGVAFSPEGRLLATRARARDNVAASLIDLTNYEAVEAFETSEGRQSSGPEYARELLDRHDRASSGRVQSPTGEWLAVMEDNTVRVYRADVGLSAESPLSDREPVASLVHERTVLRVVFSPDGRHLVTASDHDTARVWDVSLGIEVSRLSHDHPNVTDVDFHPAGTLIATASWDRTVRIWVWKPEDLVAEAATRLTRNLTHAEWHRYLPSEPYRRTIEEITAEELATEEIAGQ